MLTVSDIEGFAEAGGGIGLVTEENRVRFDINPGLPGAGRPSGQLPAAPPGASGAWHGAGVTMIMISLRNRPIGAKLGDSGEPQCADVALGVALLTIFIIEVRTELRRADEDARVLSEIVADSAIPPLR